MSALSNYQRVNRVFVKNDMVREKTDEDRQTNVYIRLLQLLTIDKMQRTKMQNPTRGLVASRQTDTKRLNRCYRSVPIQPLKSDTRLYRCSYERYPTEKENLSFQNTPDEYNGPLEAARAHIADDRYDLVECAGFRFQFQLLSRTRGLLLLCVNTRY